MATRPRTTRPRTTPPRAERVQAGARLVPVPALARLALLLPLARRLQGQPHPEDGVPRPGVHLQVAVVLVDDDPPRDVQAQPVPAPTGLVVKKGSKIRDGMAGSTPGPESATSTARWSGPSRRVRTARVPLPFIALTALSTRFVHTWLSSPGYAGISGRVWSYSLTTRTPSPIFPASITSVLSSSSCTFTVRYGARSSCEYWVAAATRVEIRSTAPAPGWCRRRSRRRARSAS
jgi:hypothetical protein